MKKNERKINILTRTGLYMVVIWWDKNDRAYLVKVPSLPNVVTFGKTLADAKKMAKDAIELYCACLLDENKVIVDDAGKVIGRVPRPRILVPIS